MSRLGRLRKIRSRFRFRKLGKLDLDLENLEKGDLDLDSKNSEKLDPDRYRSI